jgi:putative transposase
MNKQHVTLEADHQTQLRQLLSKGSLPAKTFKRATALLELHEGKSYQAVSQTLDVTTVTLSTWANKYKTLKLKFIKDAPRSGRPVEISGDKQAKVTALACSTAPDGHSQWSLRLLANKAVELGYCDHLSHTQARVILKKTNCGPT